MANNNTFTPVWIDCDPGHDDAFSILLATHSPEIQVLGISIVHGNDQVQHCGLNAKRFLWACGVKDIPVYLGSERPLIREPKFCPEIHGVPGEDGVSGLCGYHFPDDEIFSNSEYKINEGHGVLKMKDALIGSTRKVTIVATGAQTNLALLLRMFPEVVKTIEKIVFMGGAIGLGNIGVAAEYNIQIDPEAAYIVFHSGIPLVMIPLEVTHTVLVTEDILQCIKHVIPLTSGLQGLLSTTISKDDNTPHVEYDEIRRVIDRVSSKSFPLIESQDGKSNHDRLASEFGNCCYKLLTFFKSTYKEVFSFHSPPLHDPCAMFYVTDPEAFQTLKVFVDIEISSEKCAGRTLVDIYGILKKEPNVLLCTNMDKDKFWRKMLECIQYANSRSPLNKLQCHIHI